jgi:hypothetical protein
MGAAPQAARPRNTVQVRLRVSKEEAEFLMRQAARYETTQGAIIRALVSEAMSDVKANGSRVIALPAVELR